MRVPAALSTPDRDPSAFFLLEAPSEEGRRSRYGFRDASALVILFRPAALNRTADNASLGFGTCAPHLTFKWKAVYSV